MSSRLSSLCERSMWFVFEVDCPKRLASMRVDGCVSASSRRIAERNNKGQGGDPLDKNEDELKTKTCKMQSKAHESGVIPQLSIILV